MRNVITVKLVSVTVTDDDGLGNATETTTERTYRQVRFAPRSSQETTDAQQPAVINGASLYRRGDFPVRASDRIVIEGQHPLIDGTWQAEGDAGYWGVGVEVAIVRAA